MAGVLPQHRCFHGLCTPARHCQLQYHLCLSLFIFPCCTSPAASQGTSTQMMTSALWNEEWVILEKQLSLDRWQQELGCCTAQLPGAAPKALVLSVLLCPSTGPGHRTGS